MEENSRRGVIIGGGFTIVMGGVGFIVGGPYWGVELIAVGSVTLLHGLFPKLFSSKWAKGVAISLWIVITLYIVWASPFGQKRRGHKQSDSLATKAAGATMDSKLSSLQTLPFSYRPHINFWYQGHALIFENREDFTIELWGIRYNGKQVMPLAARSLDARQAQAFPIPDLETDIEASRQSHKKIRRPCEVEIRFNDGKDRILRFQMLIDSYSKHPVIPDWLGGEAGSFTQ